MLNCQVHFCALLPGDVKRIESARDDQTRLTLMRQWIESYSSNDDELVGNENQTDEVEEPNQPASVADRIARIMKWSSGGRVTGDTKEEATEDCIYFRDDETWRALDSVLSQQDVGSGRDKFPLNRCITRGRNLQASDEYLISVVSRPDIRQILSALEEISEEDMQVYFRALETEVFPGLQNDEVWTTLKSLRSLYRSADKTGRSIVAVIDTGKLAPVKRCIDALLNNDHEQRHDELYEELFAYNLTPERRLLFIEAAGKDFPGDASRFNPVSERMVKDAGWKDLHPSMIPAIGKVYDSLENKADAQGIALRILTDLASEESLKMLTCLLQRPSSKSVGLETTFVPLVGSQDFAPDTEPEPIGIALFPELFDALQGLEKLGSINQVYYVILKYAEAGLLKFDKHCGFVKWVISQTDELVDALRTGCELQDRVEEGKATDRETRLLEEMFEEVEEGISKLEWNVIELKFFLKVLRYFDREISQATLNKALDLDSGLGTLRIVAVCSLLASNAFVSDTCLEEFVAEPKHRWRIWKQLFESKRLGLFPTKFSDQSALAEAELVQWLEHPAELGVAPNEIKLLRVVEHRNEEGKPVKSFFFKFFETNFANGSWLLGMAGPYLDVGTAYLGGSDTFSHFIELDSRSIEEHIRDFYSANGDGSEGGILDLIITTPSSNLLS